MGKICFLSCYIISTLYSQLPTLKCFLSRSFQKGPLTPTVWNQTIRTDATGCTVPRRYKSCPNSYALRVEIRGMVCFLLCQAGPLASGSSVVPWAHPAEFVLCCCPLPVVFAHGVVCVGGSDATWPPHGVDLVTCTSQFPLRLWRKRVRGRLPSIQVLKVVVKEAFTVSGLQCEVETWRDGGNRSKSFRRIQGTTGRRGPFPYSMPTWRIHLRNHSEPLRFGSRLFLRGSMGLGSQKYSSLILPKALCR